MRVLIWLSVVLVGTTGALAQRGGAGHMGPNPGMPGLSPIPAVRPIPPLGGPATRGAALRPSAVLFGPYFPTAGYAIGGYDAYPSMQNVIVLQNVAEPVPPPPAKPPQSMIWEASGQPTPERPVVEEQRAFAIALKNGTTISATAVWVQDKDAHYVDADGAHMRVPLDAIDRDATRQMNRARNLVLRLPPAQ